MRREFPLLVLLCAQILAPGCDQGEPAPKPPAPPPRVAYATVSPARKAEFARAAAEALKAFDDLYGKISVEIQNSPEGPVVTVKGSDRVKPEQIEKSLGVALANFEFQAPGIRFISVGGSSWKLLFPENMQIAAEGVFKFILP